MDDNTRAVLMVIVSSGTTVGVALLKMRPRGKSGADSDHGDDPSPLDDLEVDPATGRVTDTDPTN